MRLPTAPLLLGFILGAPLEENLRRALLISRGDLSVFVDRPIAATLLALSVALVAAATLSALLRRRRAALALREDG